MGKLLKSLRPLHVVGVAAKLPYRREFSSAMWLIAAYTVSRQIICFLFQRKKAICNSILQ